MAAVTPGLTAGSTARFLQNTSHRRFVSLNFTAVSDGDTYTDANLANVGVQGWAVAQVTNTTNVANVTTYVNTTGVFTFGTSADTADFELIIWMTH